MKKENIEIKQLKEKIKKLEARNEMLELEIASNNSTFERTKEQIENLVKALNYLTFEFFMPFMDMLYSGRLIILPSARPDLVSTKNLDDIQVDFEEGKVFGFEQIKREADFYNKNYDSIFRTKWDQWLKDLENAGIKMPEEIKARILKRSKDTVHKYY